MNDIAFPYIVLRNFENLPHNVEMGEHSDLDLLVYNLPHWKEVYPNAERVHPAPRVQFKLPIGDTFVYVDARYLGDGYYPEIFEKALLHFRDWDNRGFFIPDPTHHKLALAYHVVHHKNQNKYQHILGDVTVEELSNTLQKSSVGWVKPKDPTLGRFNQYYRGERKSVG